MRGGGVPGPSMWGWGISRVLSCMTYHLPPPLRQTAQPTMADCPACRRPPGARLPQDMAEQCVGQDRLTSLLARRGRVFPVLLLPLLL